MFSWILALLLALLVWGLTSSWLWLVKRRKTEIHHGLAALAGMRWREFSQIVRRAMTQRRGLRDLAGEDNGDRGTSSDFLMEGNGQRWLLSCKHGRAYRMGAQAIAELGAARRLTGAAGGILITEGLVERDGLAEAHKQSVEILDGRVLWQELEAFVPEQTRQAVRGIARREALRQTGIAALGALALGLLAGMGYLTLRDGEEPRPAPATASPASTATAPAAEPEASADAAASGTEEAAASGTQTDAPPPEEDMQADPDPETLLRYQQGVSKALARTPGVISGIWLTRSTLSVERSADDATVWPRICREVERYPALRTVRIQLNPRPGIDEPVRWRQCRTF